MSVPYYRPTQREVEVFEHAYRNQLALMMKGPTGCGKTRFVEAMAAKVERPLVTVACHDDTTATDLLGRYLVEGGDTVWQDGPLTRALRQGAILYLDEIVEAREDVVVVLHSLADHRRQIYLDRLNETLTAPAEFMLVISFNPGYQRGFKELKPSTRQRFRGLELPVPRAGNRGRNRGAGKRYRSGHGQAPGGLCRQGAKPAGIRSQRHRLHPPAGPRRPPDAHRHAAAYGVPRRRHRAPDR